LCAPRTGYGRLHDDGLECRFQRIWQCAGWVGRTTNYTITASAGANGSIAPSGAVSVSSGSNQTFAISGNSGYVVTNVFVDEARWRVKFLHIRQRDGNSHNKRYFGAVVVNYTINATAGANGAILPSGAVSVPSGNSQTFTIGGNSGYIVTNVFVMECGGCVKFLHIRQCDGRPHNKRVLRNGVVSNSWPVIVDLTRMEPRWNSSELATKELWRASIGQGYSQVTVSGGKVYTMAGRTTTTTCIAQRIVHWQ